MREPAAILYEFGPFILDAAERLLLRHGKTVPLTPKAFESLRLLVENSGRIVEKEKLMEQVWPGTFVEEGNLSVTIFMLRKALGEGRGEQKYIETVPKRGYRFIMPVRKVPCDEQRGDQSRSHAVAVDQEDFHDTDSTAPPSGDSAPKFLRGGATLPKAARALKEPSSTLSASRRVRAKHIDSLAVLPLINGSNDPNAEYLSDGITESIINSLSQLPQLRVMSRSTVFRYKGREVDPQEVGRDMSVRAVLIGRVLQLGDRLIIRTELVDVADGWQLWGEQYNRNPADILAVQEEISQEISAKLRLKLSGEQKQRLTKRHTGSAEAYQTYLKGRYYWNKRTHEGIRKGIEYFTEAIKLDPNYALAYAGIADSYALLGAIEYSALPPHEAMQKAREAALRALAIDDTLAEAHASLAYVRIYDWNWTEAEKEYRRSIELNPNYATAHHWYGHFLTAMGRQTEAIVELMRARELDPLSLPINAGMGWHYYLTRQYDLAIAEYRKTLEMEPNFYMARFLLGMAYEQVAHYEDAIGQYQKAIALTGGGPVMIAGTAHAHAMLGRTDEARRLLAELQESSQQHYVSPYYIAFIHTGLGDKEQAFAWLRRACDTQSEGLTWLAVDPFLDSLRTDPQFTEIMGRVGLE